MADHLSNITIYLLKNFYEIGDIIREPSTSKSKKGEVLFSGTDSWFIGKTGSGQPSWINFFNKNLNDSKKKQEVLGGHFRNASSYGLYILGVDVPTKNNSDDKEKKYFAIPFGHGIHMLDMKYVESSYGLKVTVNAVDFDNLRQIDLTTPEKNSQKKKIQSSINETSHSFEINQQKDLLRGLSGTLALNCLKGGGALINEDDISKAKVYEDLDNVSKLPYPLGKSLSGKDGVRIGYRFESISEIKSMCARTYKMFLSERYKKHFKWFDNFKAVNSNDDILVQLNNSLVESFSNKEFDNMGIASPEYINETSMYDGYIFTGNGKRISEKERTLIPLIEGFYDEMVDKIPKLLEYEEASEELILKGVKKLRESCKLILKSSDESSRDKEWPLYNCISWEKELDERRYILCEGSWYQVSSSFKDEVESFFLKTKKTKSELMLSAKSDHDFGDGKVKKFEAGYNYYVVENSDNTAIAFDLGVNPSFSIGSNRNEFCDIYDFKNKVMIHVKIGKSSSSLSHLFRQGAFSSEMLKRDKSWRDEVNKILEEQGVDSKFGEDFNTSDYKVCFAIVISSNQTEDIPFFSKVSLKDAVESSITRDGYKSEFWFIYKEND